MAFKGYQETVEKDIHYESDLKNLFISITILCASKTLNTFHNAIIHRGFKIKLTSFCLCSIDCGIARNELKFKEGRDKTKKSSSQWARLYDWALDWQFALSNMYRDVCCNNWSTALTASTPAARRTVDCYRPEIRHKSIISSLRCPRNALRSTNRV